MKKTKNKQNKKNKKIRYPPPPPTVAMCKTKTDNGRGRVKMFKKLITLYVNEPVLNNRVWMFEVANCHDYMPKILAS